MISAMKKRISNNKGLTLIELIIVIAIIGILAVIGVTRFSGMTDAAKRSADEATISEVQSAAKLYVATERPAEGTFDAAAAGNVLVSGNYLEKPATLQSTNYKGVNESKLEVTIDEDGNVSTNPKVGDKKK